MKKLLFSALFLLAFSSGLFAKQVVETPVIVKEDSEVSKIIEEPQLTLEDAKCVTVWVPICDNGVVVKYIQITVCAPDPWDLLQSFNC